MMIYLKMPGVGLLDAWMKPIHLLISAEEKVICR